MGFQLVDKPSTRGGEGVGAPSPAPRQRAPPFGIPKKELFYSLKSHRLCLRDFFDVCVAFDDIMMYNVGMPKDRI